MILYCYNDNCRFSSELVKLFFFYGEIKIIKEEAASVELYYSTSMAVGLN